MSSSIGSIIARQIVEQEWKLYNWMQQQDVLGKEDKAIGKAGNPQHESSSDASQSGPPISSLIADFPESH
jgi:hypothetical protein